MRITGRACADLGAWGDDCVHPRTLLVPAAGPGQSFASLPVDHGHGRRVEQGAGLEGLAKDTQY